MPKLVPGNDEEFDRVDQLTYDEQVPADEDKHKIHPDRNYNGRREKRFKPCEKRKKTSMTIRSVFKEENPLTGF